MPSNDQSTIKLDSADPSATPSNARSLVIVFGVTLALFSFVDRICLSQTAPLISHDLGLNKRQMSIVFATFLTAYGLFGVPSAWFGDRVGARKSLLSVVTVWSFFTVLTGFAWNLASMVTIQFLFGVGDAGCFPLITKSFRAWLLPEDRTRAQSYLWTAARWGAAFAPLVVVSAVRFVGWRGAFMLFGSVAIVWIVLFAWWYKDDPMEHPSVNSGERELLRPLSTTDHVTHHVPWRRLLASRSILLLSLQYYFVSFSWFFYLTWLPTYLVEHFKLTQNQSAVYAVFPLFFCGIGSLFCGFASPHVARMTGSVGRARQVMACTGFLGAGIFLSTAAHMHTVNSTMAMMALACVFNDLIVPSSWASCMDIGGRYAASSVSGVMNMMGNLAGVSSSLLGGYILQRTGTNWNLFISILGGVYFLGILCWPFIDTKTSLDEPETNSTSFPPVRIGQAGLQAR